MKSSLVKLVKISKKNVLSEKETSQSRDLFERPIWQHRISAYIDNMCETKVGVLTNW